MEKVSSVINKFCEKYNINRISFKDKNLPTSVDKIVVFSFFGDLSSSFVFSSLLLRRIKEELKSSKYFVLLSWPGQEAFYPYVDEYWSVDDSVLEKLFYETDGFNNNSAYYSLLLRSLNEWFYEVMTYSDVEIYYKNGLTQEFLDRFKNIKISLPSINSSSFLGLELAQKVSSKDLKVFIYPAKYYNYWRAGRLEKIKINKDFWIELLDFLIKNKYYPIVYKDYFSHDLSLDFQDNCMHYNSPDISKVLTLIRLSGFVIDYFNGISKLALCARTPFLCFTERNIYNNLKDYEIDGLCGKDLIKEYVFTFSKILNEENKQIWKSAIFDLSLNKLNKIIPNINKDLLPSTVESYSIVPYSNVKINKNKKLGIKFIKINKEVI